MTAELFLILGLIVLILAGGIWAFRPPRQKKCPNCRSIHIERTGWGKVERKEKKPWYLRRGSIRYGLRFDPQKIYYRCENCGHEWYETETVPSIGRL